MDSNTHSTRPVDELTVLTAAVDQYGTRQRHGLPDAARAQRLLQLRRLANRIDGFWLQDLADLDACGAAGADQGIEAASTASWLRNRRRMDSGAAARAVRTARALFPGPLTATAQAVTDGEVSPAHAQVLADGTHHLPAQVTTDAEPVLVEAARQLDPPGCDGPSATCGWSPTPTRAGSGRPTP